VQFDFSSLSDNEFEELCMSLMRRRGFRNVRKMNVPGLRDEGRYIHAEEFLSDPIGSIIQTKILAQCKNYEESKTTIDSAFIEKLTGKAATFGYVRILIITSYELSSQAKDTALNMINTHLKISVNWWIGPDLTTMLQNNPDIAKPYVLSIVASYKFNIGILDGFARNRNTEKPCIPAFSQVPSKDWTNHLQNYNISAKYISAAEIDSSFDAILNPFGAVYPEEDFQSKTTYLRILNYINKGGLFVNVAGFPFFYYWNHNNGAKVALASSRHIWDPEAEAVRGFWSFNDTVLYKDFHVLLDSRSPTKLKIYQEIIDKKYVGDLLKLGINEVVQFRSVQANTVNAIPLVRAESGKIYPLSAIKYGNGFLMIAGLELHVEEVPIISNAIKNWLLTNGGELSLEEKS
jgi:hypothetical protein